MFKKLSNYVKDLIGVDYSKKSRIKKYNIETNEFSEDGKEIIDLKRNRIIEEQRNYGIENDIFYNDYNKEKETILILDDEKINVDSMIFDLERFSRWTQDNPLNANFFIDDYNILTIYSVNAASKYIEKIHNSDIIIDIALLDIHLGEIMTINGINRTIDGIDIAQLIKEKNTECNVRFVTACIEEYSLGDSETVVSKFKRIFNLNVKDYMIGKNEKRTEQFEKLYYLFRNRYGF